MPSAGAPSASSNVRATNAHATGFLATVRTQRAVHPSPPEPRSVVEQPEPSSLVE
jgi:hypothetical protein